MKKSMMALLMLGALPLAAAAQTSKEDIRKLAAAGISDDVILTYIRTHGPVQNLSADDLVELKKAGVSDRVLAEVTAKPAPARTGYVPNAAGSAETYSYAPSAPYGVDSYPYYYDAAWYGGYVGWPYFYSYWPSFYYYPRYGRSWYYSHPSARYPSGFSRARLAPTHAAPPRFAPLHSSPPASPPRTFSSIRTGPRTRR